MPLNASALEIGSPGFQTLIQTDRQFIAGIFGDGSFVLRQGDFIVSPNSLSHAVDISSGKAILAGNNATDQGSYFAWSDSGETLAWPAPSANPRIDTLVLRIADPQYGMVTGSIGARWDIIQGVPTASPAARSDTEINTTFFVPGAWLRVADIRLDPADTGVIPSSKIARKIIVRNPGVTEDANSDGGSVASTTFTPTLTGAATASTVTFNAPASGSVILTMSSVVALIASSPSTNNILLWRPFIVGGQYSSYTDLGEYYGIQRSVNAESSMNDGDNVSRRRKLSNLIPGEKYTITMHQRVNASGATFSIDDRSIMIEPVVN